MLLHEITAVFGGQLRVFRLERDPFFIEMVERRAGSLFKALRDFAAGDWRAEQLVALLCAGFVEGGPHRLLGRGVPEVLAAIAAHGAGAYAPLAAKIVEACLFGIAADEATFDEGNAEIGDEA